TAFPTPGPPPPPQLIQEPPPGATPGTGQGPPPPSVTPGSYAVGPAAVHAHAMQYDPNGFIFSQAMSLRQPRRTTRAQQLILDKLQNMQEQMNAVLKNEQQHKAGGSDEPEQDHLHQKDHILELVQDKFRQLPDQIAESMTQRIVDKLFSRLEQLNDTKDLFARRYTRQDTFHDIDDTPAIISSIPVSSSVTAAD
ncbi:hypothetical protein KEM54_004152, partial [Ascosphaera aggregata]